MLKNLWIYSLGLFALITFCQGETAISCRFKGVYHVEKEGRYKVLREDAESVCLSFNGTLATMQEIKLAYEVGFETCRYGFIQEGIIIPRLTRNYNCAAGYIGIYNLTTNMTQSFDVYCYNSSETRDKDCDPVILPNVIVPSYDPSIEEAMNAQDTHADTVTTTDPGKATYVPLQPTDDEYTQWTTDPQDASIDQHDEHSSSGDHQSQTTNQGMGDIDDSMSPSDDLLPLGTTKLPYFGSSHGYEDHPRVTFDSYEDTTDPYVNGNTNNDDEFTRNPGGSIPKATDSAIEKDYEDFTGENDGDSKGNGHGKGGRRVNTGHIASPDASPATDQPKQKRGSRVPDWLIVVVALVSLGLILSVCIALNTRRICGQKKKLVINGKKANLEDGAIIEQNGDTAKSQEMVQLVSHDPPEQNIRMSQEDLRNIKGVDMKIGI